MKRRRGSEGFKEQREAHLSKGRKLLEELSWRAHLLERRRAQGMEMELEASLTLHLGMRSTRLKGEGFSSL